MDLPPTQNRKRGDASPHPCIHRRRARDRISLFPDVSVRKHLQKILDTYGYLQMKNILQVEQDQPCINLEIDFAKVR